ncbi:M48 family metallopeptidase [Pseudahrensia aquimaris]|uniref:M48 family metallopeptidase n=1 Tax=Pseudahrensia aquimaris TaxID=744461 RepID=A0ABW3FJH1_9HYPH
MLNLLKKRPPPKQGKVERWTLLEIDGRNVDVRVVENPRTSRLTLRLVPASKTEESLKVTVPPGTPEDEVDGFLQRNRAWAASRLSRLPEVTRIADGVTIPLRGVPHRIVHSGIGRGVVSIGMEDDGKVIRVFGDPKFLPRKVADFLKRQAKQDLTKAVAHYADALGVKPKSITMRDTTSRWGSCSSSGALNFSWRIILAPPEVLNYLAAHEVAHLREMNHSDRFWAHVRDICPDMETHKAWLRQHGAKLHAVVA